MGIVCILIYLWAESLDYLLFLAIEIKGPTYLLCVVLLYYISKPILVFWLRDTARCRLNWLAGAKTFSKFSFISEECNTIWFINIADQTGSTWENCTIYSTAFVVVRSRGYEYLMNIFFRNVCSIFFPGSSLFLVCFVIFIVKNQFLFITGIRS